MFAFAGIPFLFSQHLPGAMMMFSEQDIGVAGIGKVVGELRSEQGRQQGEVQPEKLPATVQRDVPFTPQAPQAQWPNPVYGYGCEEASLLMSMRWARDEPLTRVIARQQIGEIARFEREWLGEHHDVSVEDTLDVLREHYGYRAAHIQRNATADTIKRALADGHIVITALNGRALSQPHYTGAGPKRHMMVVTGYDDTRNQFITNDPGTRHGASYPYDQAEFVGALQNYETGKDENIFPGQSPVIVVERATE